MSSQSAIQSKYFQIMKNKAKNRECPNEDFEKKKLPYTNIDFQII